MVQLIGLRVLLMIYLIDILTDCVIGVLADSLRTLLMDHLARLADVQ